MTDRVNALIVVLDGNYRTDDIERMRQAILCISGVVDVRLNVADAASAISDARALAKVRARVYAAIDDESETNR